MKQLFYYLGGVCVCGKACSNYDTNSEVLRENIDEFDYINQVESA